MRPLHQRPYVGEYLKRGTESLRLVAGEALSGVLIAGLVALGAAPRSRAPLLTSPVGGVAVLAAVASLCFFLYRAGRRPQGENVAPVARMSR